MKTKYKLLLSTLIVMYIVSPVDIMAGPVDDIIVTLLGAAAMKKNI